MSRRPRRNHSAAFKTKVALEALKGERTIVIPGIGLLCSGCSVGVFYSLAAEAIEGMGAGPSNVLNFNKKKRRPTSWHEFCGYV